MKQLKGRVAVVTGAASGIGLAMARRFAADGMKLVMADIETGPLARALAEIQAAGAQAIAHPVDVMAEDQVNALADAAFGHFGAVHVLCNNAGVAAPALRTRAWESTIADWQWILNVNLMGVLYGVRAFVPRMLAGGDEGHIVNTASVAGLLTGANPYHVSKHGVSCLTEGLYKDLKLMGSRVSASVLCPGLIRTGILEAETRAPISFRSLYRPSVRQDTPCLETWYGLAPVSRPATDAVLTMCPSSPPASMRGTNARTP